jgi:hypothetical protein
MQMKRRQRARELPACLQESSTPYLTTIHASRNIVQDDGYERQGKLRFNTELVVDVRLNRAHGKMGGDLQPGCLADRLLTADW